MRFRGFYDFRDQGEWVHVVEISMRIFVTALSILLIILVTGLSRLGACSRRYSSLRSRSGWQS